MNGRLAFLLALALLQGCVTGIGWMQSRLASQLEDAKGLTLHQARLPGGVIEQRDPTELRMLSNGHILHVYHDYWRTKGEASMPCDVFLEVNPKGQVIVNAYAKGDGCYSSY
jgi:hypothetical protein